MKDKIKHHLQEAMSITAQALSDLRVMERRAANGDMPELLEVADVAATLTGATNHVLQVAPYLDE